MDYFINFKKELIFFDIRNVIAIRSKVTPNNLYYSDVYFKNGQILPLSYLKDIKEANKQYFIVLNKFIEYQEYLKQNQTSSISEVTNCDSNKNYLPEF